MKKECEKFKLDLTDYAGGDISQIADMKAFEKHLKTCEDCRTELNKLRKTLGVLIAGEPRSERFQKKMDEVMKLTTHEQGKKELYERSQPLVFTNPMEAVRLISEYLVQKCCSQEHQNFKDKFLDIYNKITSISVSELSKAAKRVPIPPDTNANENQIFKIIWYVNLFLISKKSYSFNEFSKEIDQIVNKSERK